MSKADIPLFPETSALAFYLGAHQPHWLWRARFPLFVSHRQLTRRRNLRPPSCRWALDSGGFTELSLHGRWITGGLAAASTWHIRHIAAGQPEPGPEAQ